MPDENQRQRLKALVGHDMIVNVLHELMTRKEFPVASLLDDCGRLGMTTYF